jgi:adenylosuccinate synthase
LHALLPCLPDTEPIRRELAPLLDPQIADTCAEVYAAISRRVTLVDRDQAAALLTRPGTVIFEGAQGVLLDEWHGFHPYTTWSTTTFANAARLLTEAGYAGAVTRLGVLRAYATRHGPGPLVTEDAALTAALPDRHNTTNAWQRAFRVGHLDLVATRYALAVAGPVDALAVTNLDRLAGRSRWTVCHAYHYPGPAGDLAGFYCPPDLDRQAALTARLAACQPCYDHLPLAATPGGPGLDWTACRQRLGDWLDTPVTLASTGPTAADKTVLTPALVGIA